MDGLPLSLMVIDPFLEDLTGVWQRQKRIYAGRRRLSPVKNAHAMALFLAMVYDA